MLTFSTTTVASDIDTPKTTKLQNLRGVDFDSTGTLRAADYDGANITLDAIPVVPVLGVDELDLTFDQSDAEAIAYVIAGQLWLYWFDPVPSAFVSTNFGAGTEPRIDLDQNNNEEGPIPGSQIILAYQRGGNAYYRSQLDRFMVEYSVPNISNSSYFTVAGMGKNNRYQFKARGDYSASPPDTTCAGSVSIS